MNKKLIVALALVATFAFTGSASAISVAELQAQIADLTAELATLSGTVTSSAVPTITSNLTIGSTGTQVSDLQQYLINGGYMNWDGALGYFGSITKTAVSAWQAANGVSPASGYFGPISRAAMGSMTTATTGGTTVAGCSAGALFSSTTGASCQVTTVAGCSAGALFSSTTGASCSTGGTPAVVSDGTDGSLSAVYGALAPLAQTIKKGDSNKPVYAVRLSATGGNVTVNRMDVHFTDRPWLIFTDVSIKDASGNVLASKMLSAADTTTVTEGSDYYVRFDNLNINVVPGTDSQISVNVSVPASNSFVGTSPYDATSVTIPTGAIRTINGRGIYETTSVSGTSVLTLSTSGSAADLSVTLAPSSPLTSQVYVSAAGGADTTNVPLAVYRVRSSNQDTTFTSVAFTVATDPSLGDGLGTSMKVWKLSDGTNTVFGSLSGTTVTFTLSPGLLLPKDTTRDFTLSADITASSTAFAASTTLDVSATVATDANFVTPTYGGATMSGVTSDVVGSNLTFTNNSVTASGVSVTTGAGIVDSTVADSSVVVKYPVSYTFTLTNSGVSNLFVSKLPGDIVSTSTLVASVAGNVATTSITTITPLAAVPGDTSVAYAIPAGSSRTFTINGLIGKVTPATATQSMTISGIKYGTVSGTYGSTLTTGIEGLYKSLNF